MKISRAMHVMLAATLAATTVPIVAAPAQAQTLMDLLTGRSNNSNRVRVIRVPDQRQYGSRQKLFDRNPPSNRSNRHVRRAPEPQNVDPEITPIRSPQYYTYSAPSLTRVSVASLLPVEAASGSLEPSLDFETKRFAESVRHAPETELLIEKSIADELKSYYAEHPKFIWSRGNAPTQQAKDVAALLNDAGKQGLEEKDYAVVLPPDGWAMDDPTKRTSEMVEFEATMSARVIRYAMDVKDGVIVPDKLSGYHDFPAKRLTPKEAMEKLADAGDPAEWLKSLEPHQTAYGELEAELAKLQATQVDEVVIPDGTFLRPGQSDPEMPQIMKALNRKVSQETRDKHIDTFNDYDGSFEFTPERVALLKDFQRDNDLHADGIIGRNTLAKLSDDSHASKVERVKLALERLRWHPEEFGNPYVLINQPAYHAMFMRDGKTQLSTKAIVGKKTNQTSFFYDKIETVVYNPYWGVPQSIIVNEMLPKLHNDPSYLDRNGYVVTNQSGQKIASSNVAWWQYSGKVPYNVRQKPGPSNALGELKILFPNKHAIYMHDTPSRGLFERSQRALSHGCVRLQQPREMAAAVLNTDMSHITSNLGGGNEHQEKVPAEIPVYVAYFTAWPDDSGQVHFYDDMYDRDMYLSRAMNTVEKARDAAAS